MRPSSLLACSLTLAFAAFGCGGNVYVDTDGSGGATSSTTRASTSAPASSSAGASCTTTHVAVDGFCQVEGETCPIALSCCGASAVCKGGFWAYAGQRCEGPCQTACGDSGLGCIPGALCVIAEGDAVVSYLCAANACSSAADACAPCAESTCNDVSLTCASIHADQTGGTLVCDCPTC